MKSIKTVILIQKPLFEQAETLARKMKISGSRLYGIALEEYLRRHENQELFDRPNATYAEEPTLEEKEYRKRVRRSTRRLWEKYL